MSRFLQRNWLTVIGVVLGAVSGYVYYYFWGCTNGCPIKSSAWKMTLYGTAMGGLLFNLIQSEIEKRKIKK